MRLLSEDGLARRLSTKPSSATTVDMLADFNEDGQPDLLTVTFRYGAQSGLFVNTGGGRFEPTGVNLRGCWQFGVCDIDGDGRLDIVAGTDAGIRVLINRTPAAGKFINVKLKGPAENRLGVDAVVAARAAGATGGTGKTVAQLRNNTAGISAAMSVCGIGHSAGNGLPLHLGLGATEAVDVRATFPGGKTAELNRVRPAGQTVEISAGER